VQSPEQQPLHGGRQWPPQPGLQLQLGGPQARQPGLPQHEGAFGQLQLGAQQPPVSRQAQQEQPKQPGALGFAKQWQQQQRHEKHVRSFDLHSIT
jgi:hypothetical protein